MVLEPITYKNSTLYKGKHPDCLEVLSMFPEYYNSHGFVPPWIGYLVKIDNQIVGSCGFKGQPNNNKVEIAYWVFKEFEHRGIGTRTCELLVDLSKQSDPGILVTARTCSLYNDSSKILRKNGFQYIKMVPEDDAGDIYEWLHKEKNS